MKTEQMEIDPVEEINTIGKSQDKGMIQVDIGRRVEEDSDLEIVDTEVTVARAMTEVQVENVGVRAEAQDQDLDQD